ncbi:PREDICTED: uncharacterized protein LOC105456759 [Wasmannia auropunctata]|uniref:uncharacterized protein LOC105456759 n=1 Tax=Wasmannia auropunctata TaxID=64793 RepID=UPI0005EFCF7E|nr:PREDICTED: uncharacterized protein LOC105456759 [Wasmannia auropunctata]
MKLLAFGLILICCNAQAMRINGKYGNSLVEGFLEKLKAIMKTGNDTLGIPILDPFNADEMKIDVHEDQINVDGSLTKVNANGLSEYDIINGDFELGGNLVLILHLSWPLVVASTNYDIKGNAADFEIFGKGEMNLSAKEFAFNTTIYLSMDGGMQGHLKVQDMALKLSLKKLDFKITGLFDDEDLSALLSSMISDMAPKLADDEKIIYEIIEVVKQLIDEFCSTMTVEEILKLVLG